MTKEKDTSSLAKKELEESIKLAHQYLDKQKKNLSELKTTEFYPFKNCQYDKNHYV